MRESGAAKAAQKFGLSQQRYFQIAQTIPGTWSRCPLQARNLAPNATMSAPTRSFARSSVTASSIPTPRSTSSRRSSARPASRSALVVSSASSRSTAFKKKLYRYRPSPEPPLETQTTKRRTKPVPCDPRSIEHGVRGTDLGSGSAFDRLMSSARGSCSQRVDETVYLSVLFSRRRSFEGQRSGFLFPARR